MQAAFSNRAPEKRLSAAFTTAIHLALLALLLSFRPDFAEPVEPAPPLAIDLVPAPPPEARVVEPVPIEEAQSGAASAPSGQRAHRTEPGAPAPRKVREEMDRTMGPVPVASFPPGPASAVGMARDGEAGTGQAGAGAGAGGGGSGTGSGTGSKAALDAPHWIIKPTFSQMELHNPPQAAVERISGTAILACRVDSHQRAHHCRVVSETPRGYGFGRAALATVRMGRMSPVKRNGIPLYEAWVRIPVTFHNCGDGEPGCVDSRD